jgi:hypothetical protein
LLAVAGKRIGVLQSTLVICIHRILPNIIDVVLCSVQHQNNALINDVIHPRAHRFWQPRCLLSQSDKNIAIACHQLLRRVKRCLVRIVSRIDGL